MKFAAFLTLLVASLAAFTAAENIPYTVCAKKPIVELGSITVEPKIPTKKGDVATATIEAYVKEEITGGRFNAVVKVSGIPLITLKDDICKFTSCPIPVGVANFTQTFKLPLSLPHGLYEVQASAVTTAGAEITCVNVKLPIKAAPEPARAVGGSKVVFDARKQWPGLVEEAMDQGKCAGSYAVATVSSIEDRLAIAEVAKARAMGFSDAALAAVAPSFRRTSPLSALDVVVNSPYNEQCRGGNATNAFAYILSEGVASHACLPYGVWEQPAGPVRRCGFDEAPCIAPRDGPATARHSCLNGGDYAASKTLVSSPARAYQGVFEIEDALRAGGPLAVTLNAHSSLINIGDGVYRGEGSAIGQQTVKLVGWGVDDAEGAYWIAITAFGPSSGTTVFRIAKGRNTDLVETNAYGILSHA